jgi:hypothetical protein
LKLLYPNDGRIPQAGGISVSNVWKSPAIKG